jgi:hypothetical protein
MMITVAISAVVMASVIVVARWAKWAQLCMRNATRHRSEAEHYDAMAGGHSYFSPSSPASQRRARLFVSDYGNRTAYHRRMQRKWEQAAGRPWEQVSPDPPPPGP